MRSDSEFMAEVLKKSKEQKTARTKKIKNITLMMSLSCSFLIVLGVVLFKEPMLSREPNSAAESENVHLYNDKLDEVIDKNPVSIQESSIDIKVIYDGKEYEVSPENKEKLLAFLEGGIRSESFESKPNSNNELTSVLEIKVGEKTYTFTQGEIDSYLKDLIGIN